MADWNKIKTEYITTDTSYRKLAQKYGVGASTLYARAGKEKWVEQKERHQSKTVAKTLDAISDKKADRASRLSDVADRLMAKVEDLLERDAKTIEATDGEAYLLDAKGLKNLSGVLKDIKEIQMVRSDADLREQEARIAKLQREAARDEVKDTGYHGVVLLPMVAEMPAPPKEDADE